jgi:EAL domain-containing protein (putative c-di-GMP-specific phosphodiesterase class I)
VLTEACRQTRIWQHRDPARPLFTVAVNVSVRQLQQPGFPDEIAEALHTSGLDPRGLVLELTESILATETTTIIATLHALKTLGVQIAIDDFGTGYSSLSYLDQFPIDILKIDRSFANTLSITSADSSLTAMVINMGRTLNLKTVAEGIETPDQMTALQQLGCRYGQGYLLAKPMDASTVDALLDNPDQERQSHFSHLVPH